MATVNTPSSAADDQRLYLFSGQFETTLKTSLDTTDWGGPGGPQGIDWDGTNTPAMQQSSKHFLVSGQFSSTIKVSVSFTGVDADPQGISWDGTNTPWSGSEADKLYLQSGQFSATIKDSVAVGGIDSRPHGVSWDGTNTPWAGRTASKLFLGSGSLEVTVKTSLDVSGVDSRAEDLSWDGTYTPWVGSNDDKLYVSSGQFTSTILDSIAGGTNPSGITTDDVNSRLGAVSALDVSVSQDVIIRDTESEYLDPLVINVSQDVIIVDNDTVEILIPTITRVGTYDLHQDNANEIGVTVPTDAQICVVCITGWNNNTPAGPMVNKLNWDDDTGVVDFTHIIRAGSEADGTKTRAEAWYMLSSDVNWPGSGSQNIYWNTANDFEQGFNLVVLFYKGLNMTSPIVDTDYRDGPGGNWTSSLDNVGSRDMTIGCAYSTTEEGGAVADVDPGGSGQTAIVESSAYTSAFIAVGEELDEGAFVIGVG